MVDSEIDFELHQPRVEVFRGSIIMVGFGNDDDLAGICSHGGRQHVQVSISDIPFEAERVIVNYDSKLSSDPLLV